MSEFIAPSGAKIVINIAPWQDAKRLKRAIEKQLVDANIKIDLQADVAALACSIFLKVDSSEDVEQALAPCLARCTRNGEKITDMTFDKVEAREDYYDIVEACIKANNAPLVKSLLSKLQALFPAKEAGNAQLSALMTKSPS